MSEGRYEGKPIIGEYKGSPTITLPLGKGRDGKEFDFSFGLKKAKAIIEHYEAIREFVLAHE